MKNEKKKLVTCVKKVALILKLILKAQKRMKNVLLLFKKNLTNNVFFFIRKRLSLFPIGPLVVTRIYVENES